MDGMYVYCGRTYWGQNSYEVAHILLSTRAFMIYFVKIHVFSEDQKKLTKSSKFLKNINISRLRNSSNLHKYYMRLHIIFTPIVLHT